MKRNNLHLLAVLVFVAFASPTALALDEDGKATCERWLKDYNDAHCAYFSGLDGAPDAGRYIKHYNSKEEISYTRCITANTVEDDIFQEVAGDYVGTNLVEYSICSDPKGENCELVGLDSYTIAKDGEKYIGTPAMFAIDLSTVKDKYPACKGFAMNFKRSVNLPSTSKKR